MSKTLTEIDYAGRIRPVRLHRGGLMRLDDWRMESESVISYSDEFAVTK